MQATSLQDAILEKTRILLRERADIGKQPTTDAIAEGIAEAIGDVEREFEHRLSLLESNLEGKFQDLVEAHCKELHRLSSGQDV